MEIAVSGTHAVGKTTLTQFISQSFGLPLLGEQARQLLETKYKFSEVDANIDVFKAFQREILEAQIELERKYRSEGRSFVVDRTPVDSLAYVRERLTSDRDLDVHYYQMYKSIAATFMRCNRYSRVYFVRYDPIFHEDDGNRNINPFLMETIDSLIETELNRIKELPLMIIRSTDREERRRLVGDDIIQLLGATL